MLIAFMNARTSFKQAIYVLRDDRPSVCCLGFLALCKLGMRGLPCVSSFGCPSWALDSVLFLKLKRFLCVVACVVVSLCASASMSLLCVAGKQEKHVGPVFSHKFQ